MIRIAYNTIMKTATTKVTPINAISFSMIFSRLAHLGTANLEVEQSRERHLVAQGARTAVPLRSHSWKCRLKGWTVRMWR